MYKTFYFSRIVNNLIDRIFVRKVIAGGFVTKLEFLIKIEKYEKKQKIYKWGYCILGIFFTAFAFIPSTIMFFDENMFGLRPIIFAILGGGYLNKTWGIIRGTEEHELLINALDLLSTSNAS